MQLAVRHQPADCRRLRNPQSEPSATRRLRVAGVPSGSDIVGADAAGIEAGLSLSSSTHPAA